VRGNSRPRLFSTDAIILKRADFGEADRILTVLTPLYGKWRLVAKGVRRSASRMAGHLEPFCHAQLMVARGRELDLATQATTVEAFRRTRQDMVRSSQAFHLTELVDAFLQERDPHPEVFELLRSALTGIEEGTPEPALVARHFELSLLGLVGFQPQIVSCLGCDSEVEPVANAYSVPRGGVFCPTCKIHEPSARAISVDALKLLRVMQRSEDVRRLQFRMPAGALNEVESVLHLQLEFVLERRLRARGFVRHLAETGIGYSA